MLLYIKGVRQLVCAGTVCKKGCKHSLLKEGAAGIDEPGCSTGRAGGTGTALAKGTKQTQALP